MESVVFSLEQIMPLTWWAISLLCIALISLLFAHISLSRKFKRFQTSYISLQTFMSGKKLDDLLDEVMKKLEQQDAYLHENENRIEKVETKVRSAVDQACLVKFNAFDHVGGELSFALALLNQQGDGVVLSAIHSREESRVYAKPILKGASSQPLSKEEVEAINGALKGKKI